MLDPNLDAEKLLARIAELEAENARLKNQLQTMAAVLNRKKVPSRPVTTHWGSRWTF